MRQSLRRSTRAQSMSRCASSARVLANANTSHLRINVPSESQAVPNTPMGLKTPAFDPRLPYTPAAGRCPRRYATI